MASIERTTSAPVAKSTIEMHEFAMSTETSEWEDASIWQAIKATPKVIAYCACLGIGPLIYGFDNIIISVVTSMPAFQASFGTPHGSSLIIPALWLALWNAFIQAGVIIGSAINGPIADRIGRRLSFAIGGSISTLDRGSDVGRRRGTFLAGKIILGVALGILNSTCQTYIAEVAPRKLRGPLLSFFTFFMVMGQLIAVSLVFARIAILTPSSYIVCFASQWGPSVFALFVGFLIPESSGSFEAARKAIGSLFHEREIDARIVSIRAALDAENDSRHVSEETSYLECFKGPDWRRTRIVLYANVLQQCLGTTMIANGSYFLQLGGMSPNHSVMVSQIGVGLGLPANVAAWFAMSYLGRRFILLWSTGAVGFLWLGVGIAGCFASSVALWAIGVMIVIISVVYGLGVGGTYPVVGAETSSMRLRAYTQGIGFIMNGFASLLFNFFVPYMFDVDQANLGGKIGFFFAGICFIAVLIVWLEVPEMKDRTYEELDEMFAKQLPTRQFKGYRCEGLAVEEMMNM
ncbi:major facilitator superfamily domain, general substrate transporter [Lipomyces orientalis]|uniref:Major facilitator superfamily domain, general substrate transporter n=1 Tax=Lipomyces orientalis TaxID=1233043 RepID=A0ACC3TEP6_9ASCO